MKKSLLALAVLGTFTGVASAQSSVTIYGKVDVGLVYESGAVPGINPNGDKTVKVTSGVSGGSRLGFRGVEDMGGGLKARFQLETGLCADSAAANPQADGNFCGGGNFMGRTAIVALDGGFGSLQLGRQYSPSYLHQSTVDPFGDGLAGEMEDLFPINKRINNSILYSIPAMGGFNASLLYGAGEVAGDNSAARVWDVSGSYTAGPLYVGLSYDRQNGPTTPNHTETKGANIGATYDFGMAKAHFMYQTSKLDDPVLGTIFDTADWLLGVSVPLGQGTLMASYIRNNDKTAANDHDANKSSIGYMYSLSKRTQLYAAYAKISNKDNAQFTVGNATEAGSGDKALNFGIVHNF